MTRENKLPRAVKLRMKHCERNGSVCGHGKLPCNPKCEAVLIAEIKRRKK